jgi:TolB-like protein/DNA-binding winged helix-turn-helix (wHTH) protein
MQALASSEVFLFEDFRLDRRGGGLFRRDGNGGFVPVALGSRGLDILGVLIERAGEVVSKDEIIAAVWPGMVVEDSNLTVQISALRRVLDRGRSRGGCIRTVPGRGYRFVAARVQPVAEAASAPSPVDDAPLVVASPAIDVSVRRQLPRSLQRIGSTRRSDAILAPAIAAVVGAALVLAAGAWWLWPTIKPSPAPDTAAAATSTSQPIVAPRLSIVVLPFANLSDDPDQQYFADGLTDDLTTDLSRIPDMFVIARNTAFTYRNKLIDAKQIGRELGVRYLLEGSVQRSGGEVRVNAQLIDAETHAHLWAQRFDRETGDLFALQNEITTRIAVALNQELTVAEAARRTERPDVLDYILRFRAIMVNTPPGTPGVKASRFLEQAVALDPQSAEAQSWLAYVLAGRVLANMTDSPTVDLERAKALSEQAVATSPRSQLAHIAKGQVLRAQRRYAEAITEYETVLALDRNWVFAYFALGQCKFHTGSLEEAIPLIERAIQLSPRDSQLGVWFEMIGDVHLLQGRTDQAIIWLEKARNHTPAHSIIRADLAAAYGLAGEVERAATELAEARRLSPDDRYLSLGRLRKIENWGVPKIRALREATKFEGLRKAGMPEE